MASRKNGGTIFQRIVFRVKMWEMDMWWYLGETDSWRLFPPSFYYTHTKEEIKQITAETAKSLVEQLDDM